MSENYNPGGPKVYINALQGLCFVFAEDLESQIEDLTEVNESALARYNLLEEEHKKLMEEHQDVSLPSISLLQQQNKELQQQVDNISQVPSQITRILCNIPICLICYLAFLLDV